MIRFRLFGIPFEITPYFWIGSAILGSRAAVGNDALWLLATWVLCVLVSIVAHELGHALAARRYGVQPSVALYQFGGLTFLPGATLSRGQHIVVSLAGPAAGGVMFLAVHSLRHLLGVFEMDNLLYEPTRVGMLFREAIRNLLWINGWWTVFNLLPILPLDGGQVLRDVLGPRQIRTCQIVGAVCAVACAVWAWQVGMVITAFFVGYLAYSNLVGDTRSFTGGVTRG